MGFISVCRNIKKGFHASFFLLAALVLLCGLSGCKPTDFFTEIVITPFSNVEDTTNAEKTIINSPDATAETDQLSALSWTDASVQSQAVNRLVTFSKNPTSNLEAHHSIFSLTPLLPGIEASDGVKIVYSPQSTLDKQANETPPNAQNEQPNVQSTSTGANTTSDATQTNPTDNTSADQAASSSGVQTPDATNGTQGNNGAGAVEGQSAGGSSASQTNDGTGNNPNSNTGTGTSDVPSGGSGGVAKRTYNPQNDALLTARANKLAVVGDNLATLVQMIGGSESICALTTTAYYGDAQRTRENKQGTALSFKDVFAATGEIDTSDFEANRILWTGNGSTQNTLIDADKLVQACGQDGIIIYDEGSFGSYSNLFTNDVIDKINAANIMLLPVNMQTVQGIKDAASLIGTSLSESKTCGQNATQMAQNYNNAVDSIVLGAASSHTDGTYIASQDANSQGFAKEKLTLYNSARVSDSKCTNIVVNLGTDCVRNLQYTGESQIDISSATLFNWASPTKAPYQFYLQTAGAYSDNTNSSLFRQNNNTTTNVSSLLFPYTLTNVNANNLGTSTHAAYITWANNPIVSTMGKTMSTSSGATTSATYGLGSKYQPYFIVCASNGLSATDVKNAVVNQINAQNMLYSAYRYDGSAPANNSTIGATNGDAAENPFFTGLSAQNVVRANPCGLLGSWSGDSAESVLEAAWAAELYSHSPGSACAYTPINSASNFSCEIAGIACANTQQATEAFYEVFYRASTAQASTWYASAVPETFEGLS